MIAIVYLLLQSGAVFGSVSVRCFTEPSGGKEKATVFYVSFEITGNEAELELLSTDLSTATVFEGDYAGFQKMIEEGITKPVQKIRYDEIEKNKERYRGRFVCSGIIEGNSEILLNVFQEDEKIETIRIPIEIISNNLLKKAIEKRWEQKKRPDHFGSLILEENAIFYNEQYIFTMIAAKRTNLKEQLDLTGFFYYTPSLSHAKALSYEIYAIETLDGSDFVLKLTDIAVNPNPLLKEEAKTKIFYPYLEWSDLQGNLIKDLSYEDEYLEVLYQKPVNGSFTPFETIVLNSWEGTKRLEVGEIGTLELIVESKSRLLDKVFKILTIPGTDTLISSRNADVNEKSGIREISWVYRFSFDFIPTHPGTYTTWIEPFDYLDVGTGVQKHFYSEKLTINVDERATETAYEGIVNPLKPLREKGIDLNGHLDSFNSAVNLANQNRLEEAKIIFSELLDKYPLSSDLLYNLGWVSYYQKQYGESQLYFYRSCSIDFAEDSQYNIRFIESSLNLSGRPLYSIKRINRGIHFLFLISGCLFCLIFVFYVVIKAVRYHAFSFLRETAAPEKKQRNFFTFLLFIGCSLFFVYFSQEIQERSFERNVVIQYETYAYAGPSYNHPTIGEKIQIGNAGKFLDKNNEFCYIEYISSSPNETGNTGLISASVRYWIPEANLDFVIDTLFF
jgi:hypothetical protein